jgi:DNA-binding response OmpR family regulator
MLFCTKYLRENQEYTNNSKEKKFSTKRILLVDDELDITSSLKMGLEDNGFVVNTYNDAELALSDFKSGVYDLVLLDIKMPQINGFELYEKIKEIDSNVKACFITAHEVYYESLKEIFPTMDCDCYVKPIKMEDLVRRVKAHLSS